MIGVQDARLLPFDAAAAFQLDILLLVDAIEFVAAFGTHVSFSHICSDYLQEAVSGAGKSRASATRLFMLVGFSKQPQLFLAHPLFSADACNRQRCLPRLIILQCQCCSHFLLVYDCGALSC